jgi:iron complex transport system ATP-binding protein
MSGISIEQLCIGLRGRPVIHDLTTRFERGRVTALLGPNGAGKTTLLNCLTGLLHPDSGKIQLDGTDLPSIDRRTRARRIGLLPQQGEVYWDVDVATLVSLGRFPHRGRWGASPHDTQAVLRAMAATDVSHFADRSARALSGGERSRVLLARVLAGEPEWLLADEPLASLDPAHQLDVLDLLREVAARGAGVIVVLHDLGQAVRVADDVLLMREGRVVAQGPRRAVMEAPELRATFGIDVHIGDVASGERFVVPLRRSR